jgi:hypothetical protein
LNIESFEEVESIPKIGDLWLPIATVSPFHKITSFFLGINVLFVVGDKVIRIEHYGVESKTLVWRLGRNAKGSWLWNFEHDEKMQYESHQLSIGSYIMITDDTDHDLDLY